MGCLLLAAAGSNAVTANVEMSKSPNVETQPVPVELLGYQQRMVTNPARFGWYNWSRQTGKSFAASLRRILRGMERRRDQIFLSASERQSRELMGTARKHIAAMKIASDYHEFDLFDDVHFKQLEIRLPAVGIRIIGLAANPNTARGFTGDVLLDEFAMHRRDRDIWASIYPTVLRGAGELDVCSTPKGRQNMFYALQANSESSHDTLTIDDAIAQGLKEDREVLRRGMGDDELFRQEFLCEFVDEATAFLTYEQIAECEDARLPRELSLAELKAHAGDVVVGMDIGRKKDLTVIWALEAEGRMLRSLGLLELSKMPFREQFETLSQVLQCRCVRRCAIDASGLGMQLAEEAVTQFGDYKVEACTLTATFKEQAASLMRNKFADKLLRIPVDERIRNDLHSVRKIVTSAGNIRLEAPREEGSHADRFWALALACYAGSEPAGKIEVTMGPALKASGARRL